VMWRPFSAALTGGGTWRSLASGSPMAGGLTGWMTTCNGGVGLVGRIEVPDSASLSGRAIFKRQIASFNQHCRPTISQHRKGGLHVRVVVAGQERSSVLGRHDVNADKLLWRTLVDLQHVAVRDDPWSSCWSEMACRALWPGRNCNCKLFACMLGSVFGVFVLIYSERHAPCTRDATSKLTYRRHQPDQ
jgi:hypothetical protein